MRFQLGAMSVGDIFDRGLKLLLSRLGTFYVINLIVMSPLIVFQMLAPTVLGFAQAVVIVGALILYMILYFVGMAAVIKVIEQEHIDHRVGIGEALGFAMTRFVPLLLGSIIFGLVVLVGLVLCVVPGIIFLCMFTFASQAIVLERAGPIEGMNRSAELTKGHKGRIFGLYILIFVLTICAGIVLQLALHMVIPAGEQEKFGQPVAITNQTNHMLQVLITALVNILVSTYGTICLTLAYFDTRTRKEGFDLELMAKGLPQEERRYRDDDERDDDRFGPRRRDDDERDYDDERDEWRRERDRYNDEDDRPDDRPRRRDD